MSPIRRFDHVGITVKDLDTVGVRGGGREGWREKRRSVWRAPGSQKRRPTIKRLGR